MGTEYILIKKGDLAISLDEHSNVFDLTAFGLNPDNELILEIVENLTPAEIIGMALEMLKTTSYWEPEYSLVARDYMKARSDKDYYQELIRQIFLDMNTNPKEN